MSYSSHILCLRGLSAPVPFSLVALAFLNLVGIQSIPFVGPFLQFQVWLQMALKLPIATSYIETAAR